MSWEQGLRGWSTWEPLFHWWWWWWFGWAPFCGCFQKSFKKVLWPLNFLFFLPLFNVLECLWFSNSAPVAAAENAWGKKEEPEWKNGSVECTVDNCWLIFNKQKASVTVIAAQLLLLRQFRRVCRLKSCKVLSVQKMKVKKFYGLFEQLWWWFQPAF